MLVTFIFGLGGPENRVYLHSRDFDRNLHETLGVVVFDLTLSRIVWKILSPKPAPIDLARWMVIVSRKNENCSTTR